MSELITLEEQIESLLVDKEANRDRLIESYEQLVSIQEEEGDFESAISASTSIIELMGELSKERQGSYYYKLAELCSKIEDWDRALVAVEQSIAAYGPNSEAHEELALAYHRKGVILVNQGKLQECLDEITKAQNIAKANDLLYMQGKCSGTFGDLNNVQEEYKKAISDYKSAILAYKEVDGHDEMGRICQKVGDILLKHDRHKEAISSYQEGAGYFAITESHLEVAMTQQRMATVYEKLSDNYSAAAAYEKAAGIFVEVESPLEAANSYYQAAYMMEDEKDWTEAIRNLELALPLAVGEDGVVLKDTIEDSLDHAKQQLTKNGPKKSSPEDKESNGGFFSKIKGIFGG